MRVPTIVILSWSLLLTNVGKAHATAFADFVNGFSGGLGYGVLDGSAGSYTGAVGPGMFDALAVTSLDGAVLGLGVEGATSPPGHITVSFSMGSVLNGLGADIRLYDSFGVSEGFSLEASADNSLFFPVGTFGGDPAVACTPMFPCTVEMDLPATLPVASFFRITARQFSIPAFPAAYDLDAVEAIHFQPSASVPEPSTFLLFAASLLGVVTGARRRSRAMRDTVNAR